MSIDFARRCVLLPLAIVVLSSAATADDDERRSEALVAKVERLFETCNRPDVPGCAVGIIRDSR